MTNEEKVQEILDAAIPSMKKLRELEEEWKGSAAFAWFELERMENHMKDVHAGKIDECLDTDCHKKEGFSRPVYEEHVKKVMAAIINFQDIT